MLIKSKQGTRSQPFIVSFTTRKEPVCYLINYFVDKDCHGANAQCPTLRIVMTDRYNPAGQLALSGKRDMRVNIYFIKKTAFRLFLVLIGIMIPNDDGEPPPLFHGASGS